MHAHIYSCLIAKKMISGVYREPSPFGSFPHVRNLADLIRELNIDLDRATCSFEGVEMDIVFQANGHMAVLCVEHPELEPFVITDDAYGLAKALGFDGDLLATHAPTEGIS